MNVIKKVIKSVSFILIVAIGIFGLDSLLVAKNLEGRWDTLNTANSFYDLPDNSIDVFFVGTSDIAAAADPYQMYNEFGISAFNMGIASQSADGTYFWLKEVFKTQSPSLIVMDAKTFGRFDRPIEPYCRKSFDAMKWGITKLQYAQYYGDEYDKDKQQMIDSGKEVDESKLTDSWSYYFPLNTYHSRWSSLNELDFIYAAGLPESKSLTRGFMTMNGRSGIDYKGIDFDAESEKYTYDEEALEYYYKIIDLCKDNNAEFLLMKTPDSEWGTARHKYIQKIADEKNILFYDMNSTEILEKMEFDYAKDASDYMHVNTDGAKKTTSFLGRYIKNNFELKDYRETKDEIHDFIEEGLEVYKCEIQDADLRMTFNITDYFNSIEDRDNYSYIITTGSGLTAKFSDGQKQQLYNMGFTKKMVKYMNEKNNMIAVVDGKGNYLDYSAFTDKQGNNLLLSKETILNDGTVCKVVSMKSGQSISIGSNQEIINYTNKFYMVTYDNVTHKVVDAVFFDVDENGYAKTGR